VSDVILTEGHRSWIPLALDLAPEETAADLRRRFGGPDGETDQAFELNLAAAQGTVTNLQQQSAVQEQQGTITCAAWLLTREPTRLDIRAVAILRASAVSPEVSTDVLVGDVIGGAPRHGEPLVEPFETHSGEAFRIRYRTVVRLEGEDAVHQINAVMWPRQESGAVFVLSTYVDSLLEATEIGDLLDELGAGTRGI
jgi:hypothetical protein